MEMEQTTNTIYFNTRKLLKTFNKAYFKEKCKRRIITQTKANLTDLLNGCIDFKSEKLNNTLDLDFLKKTPFDIPHLINQSSKSLNKIYLLPVLLLGLLSCKTVPEREAEITEINKTNEIDILANRYLELGRFSGTVLVTKGDSVIYTNNFGLADYENELSFSDTTSFKIGEISELITGNIIRNMAEKGHLTLSDPISTYLPEIKGNYSIEDLLNHKSSLPGIKAVSVSNPDIEYSLIEYANLGSSSAESEKRSDLGYNLLGLVIEKVANRNFGEVVSEYMEELGLENTYFQKEDPAAAVGYLYHNYRGEGMELQRSASYDPNKAYSSRGLKSTAGDLAVIFNNTPDEEIAIEGYIENDGFSYSVVKNTVTNTPIIFLSNRRHPVAKEISNSISAIYRDEPYNLPLSRTYVSLDPVLLKEYAGTYSLNEQMNLEVIFEKDRLFIVMGPNKIYLVPQSTNQFFMEERDASVRFIRDRDNRVQKAVLLDGFLEGTEITRQL